MEQNSEPRNKLMSLWSINIWQRKHSIQLNKDNTKWCWGNWTSIWKKKKVKLDHHLTPHTRINSKWIKNLNISHGTIKVLEETIGCKISDISCSNIFANISPRAREIKEKIKRWDYIKPKTYAQVKNHHFHHQN